MALIEAAAPITAAWQDVNRAASPERTETPMSHHQKFAIIATEDVEDYQLGEVEADGIVESCCAEHAVRSWLDGCAIRGSYPLWDVTAIQLGSDSA